MWRNDLPNLTAVGEWILCTDTDQLRASETVSCSHRDLDGICLFCCATQSRYIVCSQTRDETAGVVISSIVQYSRKYIKIRATTTVVFNVLTCPRNEIVYPKKNKMNGTLHLTAVLVLSMAKLLGNSGDERSSEDDMG